MCNIIYRPLPEKMTPKEKTDLWRALKPFVDLGHLKQETINKKARTKRTATTEQMDMFEAFWAAFNYKKDRKNAITAFLAIRNIKDEYEKIIHGAKMEAKQRKNNPGATPKMAQGWLNDERWNDYEHYRAEKESVIEAIKEPTKWKDYWKDYTGSHPEREWSELLQKTQKEIIKGMKDSA